MHPSAWNDFVAVFVRDSRMASRYVRRMHAGREDVENVHSSLHDGIHHFTALTEDLRRLHKKTLTFSKNHLSNQASHG